MSCPVDSEKSLLHKTEGGHFFCDCHLLLLVQNLTTSYSWLRHNASWGLKAVGMCIVLTVAVLECTVNYRHQEFIHLLFTPRLCLVSAFDKCFIKCKYSDRIRTELLICSFISVQKSTFECVSESCSLVCHWTNLRTDFYVGSSKCFNFIPHHSKNTVHLTTLTIKVACPSFKLAFI